MKTENIREWEKIDDFETRKIHSVNQTIYFRHNKVLVKLSASVCSWFLYHDTCTHFATTRINYTKLFQPIWSHSPINDKCHLVRSNFRLFICYILPRCWLFRLLGIIFISINVLHNWHIINSVSTFHLSSECNSATYRNACCSHRVCLCLFFFRISVSFGAYIVKLSSERTWVQCTEKLKNSL